MSEFWLISAPGDKENLQALERMNTVTSKSNLSYNTKFAIPDFKVGTLDSLVGLSDELGKLDAFAESLIKRMAQSVVEVMEDAAKGKAQENLLANGGLKEKMKCLKIDLTSFVTHFEWDMAKYPAKQPLPSLVDTLAKQLAQIETDLKARTAAYSALKATLDSLNQKAQANLFTRTLSDIVSKDDFVLDSEYLVTLLVIVPTQNYVQWQKTYESLSDMVVPRSTKLICEDKEGGLFTVTLFRKVIDDFKARAKENKFMVREFYYDEKEITREREEMARLLTAKKQQYVRAPREFPGCAPPASQEVLYQALARGPELRLQTPGRGGSCQHAGRGCGHPWAATQQPRLLPVRVLPHRPQPSRLARPAGALRTACQTLLSLRRTAVSSGLSFPEKLLAEVAHSCIYFL
ncbi:V-type proton ATPase subunit C 2 isoform X4 [Pipistrellus kuhlii]|uniref:V-type proton ATPase subunit C 2 isoform X4 n=1 Tax=Pipistrellus kuhlii TaxID=59472 RepID=UPI00174F1E5D|nr:V-type proton ATPase subunit C 2 isoform X4 [Pipistrellus kuhlii]